MAGYLLTLGAFQLRTIMPPAHVQSIESVQPGWLLAQDAMISRRIDGLLRKRYAVPFEPPPEIVLAWVSDILTQKAYLRLGVDPTDAQVAEVFKAAEQAWADVNKAADSVEGLFDLPLTTAAGSATAISKGAPRVYSEASPWAWTDTQRETAWSEDNGGGGGSYA